MKRPPLPEFKIVDRRPAFGGVSDAQEIARRVSMGHLEKVSGPRYREACKPPKHGPHVLGVILRAKLAHQASIRSFAMVARMEKTGDDHGAAAWESLAWTQHEVSLELLRKLPAGTWAVL